MKERVFVLAHPRTGSSLLMQSFKILGLNVLGDRNRNDLPNKANPKGYFEDKAMLFKGLTEENIFKIENTKESSVVIKFSLESFLDNLSKDGLDYLKSTTPIIIIPIRRPIESALSNYVFVKDTKFNKFAVASTFLYKYRSHYKTLSDIIVNTLPELESKIHFVDYSLPIASPTKYIDTLLGFIPDQPGQEDKTKAINNIDSELYRYNLENFEKETLDWENRLEAKLIYDILVESKHPFQDIQKLLGN